MMRQSFTIVHDRGMILCTYLDEQLVRDTWRDLLPENAGYARLVRKRVTTTETIIDDNSDDTCQYCGHRLFRDGTAWCRALDGGAMCSVSPDLIHYPRDEE